MIWDLHTHLSQFAGRTPQERMAQLMRYADRMGIDRVVLFLGIPPHAQNPTPQQLVDVNNQVLEALAHWHDRAVGFAYVNPNHVQASLDEMQRCIGRGPMVGIKLWVAAHCDHQAIDPIIRLATEMQAVVFQHTWIKSGNGNGPGESTPMDLAELASRHPQARLICGHAGGNWERGIRAIRAHKNISLGTAGFDPTAGVTEMAVRELGPGRVIYGSDAGGRSFASQLAKITGADIGQDAKRRILGENLHQLLKPILAQKGIHFG